MQEMVLREEITAADIRVAGNYGGTALRGEFFGAGGRAPSRPEPRLGLPELGLL